MASSRFSRFFTLIIGTLALASWAHVVRDPVPHVFDGQYTHPTPENGGVEWKYFQLIADPVGDNPPASLSVLFYQGYTLQFGPRDPTLPQYYLDVTGTFPNGTTFNITVPAEFVKTTARGQEVTSTWGTVARFRGSPDLSYTAKFTAPQFGLEGSFNMTSRGKHHLNCNTTTEATFNSAIPAGTKLTAAENFIYREIGWLTSVPRGKVSAEFIVKGSRLHFSGQGYHDANYAPGPFNTVVETWYSAVGQVGPYDLTYMFLVPINSTKIFTAGYLAHDGVVLQNHCTARSPNHKDAVTVSPYGVVKDAVSGDDNPAGFLVQYNLVPGELYEFNFTSSRDTQIVDLGIYHRWIGSVRGGKVGGKTYEGPFAYEWLNPSVKAYVPPSSS